jgi:Zn-dependent alcohol dehydrogenase
MPAFPLTSEDKRLCGGLYGTQARRDIPRIADLAETRRLDLSSLVTRRLPLDKVNDAICALEAGVPIPTVVVVSTYEPAAEASDSPRVMHGDRPSER